MYCIDDLFDVFEKVVDTRNNLVSNKPDGYVLKDEEVILYFLRSFLVWTLQPKL